MGAQCEHQTKAGARCRARTLIGKSTCFLHSDPENAKRVGQAGGERRRLLAAGHLKKLETPQSTQEIAHTLAQILCEVRAGRIAPKTGAVLASLGMAAIKGFEAKGPLDF
jgi:hypothetical protein